MLDAPRNAEKSLSSPAMGAERSCGHGGAFLPRGRLRGQTLIYLMGVLGMLMLMGLWLFDTNTAVVAAIRAQNAADASALAAAQWQARSLNAIGELNLVKAINTLMSDPPPGNGLQAQLATATDPTNAFAIIQAALDSLQSEISFVGPMVAMEAAQQAAMNNGVPVNSSYTQFVRDHATQVADSYGTVFSPGPWQSGRWAQQYADMLNWVADEGVAAAADNYAPYGGGIFSASPEAQRYLLSLGFYCAIYNRDWCALQGILLGGYSSFSDWGPVSIVARSVGGSEFFGLDLDFAGSANLTDQGMNAVQWQTLGSYFQNELSRRNLVLNPDWNGDASPILWAVYASSYWGGWDKAHAYRDSLVADPRPVYDYAGCDAVTRVVIPHQVTLALTNRGSGWTSWLAGTSGQQAVAGGVSRLKTLDQSDSRAGVPCRNPYGGITASAAAKPFGALPGVSEPASTFRIVLPVFQEVRLVPVALASQYGNADPAWFNHRWNHLPNYSTGGLGALDDQCFYCQQLMQWEDAAFRQEGIDWLNATDPLTGSKLHTCEQHGGGGGGGTGGIPVGH